MAEVKKRKHRVVVELTTSKPITEKEAVLAMQLLHQRIDLDQAPIWANALNIYADKLAAKSFSRVLTSRNRKAQHGHPT